MLHLPLHKAAVVHKLLHTSWSDTENNDAEGNSALCNFSDETLFHVSGYMNYQI